MTRWRDPNPEDLYRRKTNPMFPATLPLGQTVASYFDTMAVQRGVVYGEVTTRALAADDGGHVATNTQATIADLSGDEADLRDGITVATGQGAHFVFVDPPTPKFYELTAVPTTLAGTDLWPLRNLDPSRWSSQAAALANAAFWGDARSPSGVPFADVWTPPGADGPLIAPTWRSWEVVEWGTEGHYSRLGEPTGLDPDFVRLDWKQPADSGESGYRLWTGNTTVGVTTQKVKSWVLRARVWGGYIDPDKGPGRSEPRIASALYLPDPSGTVGVEMASGSQIEFAFSTHQSNSAPVLLPVFHRRVIKGGDNAVALFAPDSGA